MSYSTPYLNMSLLFGSKNKSGNKVFLGWAVLQTVMDSDGGCSHRERAGLCKESAWGIQTPGQQPTGGETGQISQ